MHKDYCLNSKKVIEKAAEATKKNIEDFKIGKYAILLFSHSLLEFLIKKLNMKSFDWLAPYHPYASNQIYKGELGKLKISALAPPMGASPIASVAEDLINCGAKGLLLVCGAWGIAKNAKLLDYLIPTHAIGPDGTSIYYGRKSKEKTRINEKILDIIKQETKKRTHNYHVGKNYSMEAFYKIKPENVRELQNNGFISMENGELNTLATICNLKKVKFGAIFYNYYNPLKSWTIPWLEEDYKKCVELEGKISLGIIKKMANSY